MLKNKYFWIVVVVLLIALAWLMSGNYTEVAGPTPSPTSSPTLAPKPKVQATPKSGTAQQTKLYSELVEEYVGRHIQFDINCQAIPVETTYKSGTSVLFDNRSGDARTIKIGGIAYTLAGYGYQIVTLASKALPSTLSLNCGSAVNVGKVLLQN